MSAGWVVIGMTAVVIVKWHIDKNVWKYCICLYVIYLMMEIVGTRERKYRKKIGVIVFRCSVWDVEMCLFYLIVKCREPQESYSLYIIETIPAGLPRWLARCKLIHRPLVCLKPCIFVGFPKNCTFGFGYCHSTSFVKLFAGFCHGRYEEFGLSERMLKLSTDRE